MLIWDIDGVLIHSQDKDGQFYWTANIERDLNIPHAATEAIFNSRWNDVLVGKISTRSHIFETFEQQGISQRTDEYISYWLQNDVRINADTAQFLSANTSCIATNQDPLRTEAIKTLFAGRVHKIYASCHIGAVKPSPEYYEYIERDLALTPQELCLIDDKQENVSAAISRGWDGHVYKTVEELKKFLRQKLI